MVRLERLGIATAAVATEPFLDEALEQARLLGGPAYRMVYIPHPVQLLTLGWNSQPTTGPRSPNTSFTELNVILVTMTFRWVDV